MLTFDCIDEGTQLKVNSDLESEPCFKIGDIITVERDSDPPKYACGLVLTCRNGNYHSIESFLKIEIDENGHRHVVVYGFDKVNN